MKLNIGTLTLRLLAVVPVLIALVVLVFAALFTTMAIRESLWFLIASIAFLACAVILLRCSYVAWRRPSPDNIREVCEWVGHASVGIALVAFVNLDSPGAEWLRWGVLAGSFVVVVFMQPLLTRFLLRRIFGAGRLSQA